MTLPSRLAPSLVLVAGLATGCDPAMPQDPVPVVASVQVVPAVANLEPGQTAQLTARVFDDASNPLNRSVSWSSTVPAVATVSSSGLVTAVAEGVSSVRAEVDGRSGASTVNVAEATGAAVASVDVAPPAAQLVVGQSVALAVTPRDASGTVLTGRTVSWTSSSAAVATVDGSGVVQGRAPGTAQITARVEGVDGGAQITVTAPQGQDGVVDVDPITSFQTIQGWEGVAQMGQLECGAGYDGWKDEVADRLVNELGINRVRMEVRSGHENTVNWYAQRLADPSDQGFKDFWYTPVNDNGDPNVANPARFFLDEIDHQIQTVIQPLQQAMATRGEELFISLCFVDFGTTSFHRTQPAEYAELMAVVFDHIQQTYGWSPDAVEVMLEPDLGGSWQPSQVAAALAATGQRLEAAGFTPEFVAPSVTNMADAVPWMNVIAQNATAMRYLDEFSYHRYQGASRQAAAAIATLAGQLGLRTAMLEHIDAGIDELWEDLTLANVSSWEQFALAYCSANPVGTRYYSVVNGTVSLVEKNRPFLQIFPFVRRGAVRHGTMVRDASLRAMSFRNPDGRWAVIVQTPGPKQFTVGKLPAGSYTLSYTGNDGATAASLGQVTTTTAGELITVNMPAAGLVTLYGG